MNFFIKCIVLLFFITSLRGTDISKDEILENSTKSFFEEENKQKINELFNSLPREQVEIEAFTQKTLMQLEEGVTHYLASDQNDFSFVIRGWHEIFASTLTKRMLLVSTSTEKTRPFIEVSILEMDEGMKQAMSKPEVLSKVLHFMATHSDKDSLLPSELNYVQALLHSMPLHGLDSHLKNSVEELKSLFANLPSLSYRYLEGNGPEKKFSENSFTILNLNTCFLWDMLPMCWGGVLPWEMRIDEMVEKIKSQKADIVCLQEVFDEKAALALYDKLSDEYRYFYINIGPTSFGFSEASFSLPSGLFVASRYEVQDPEFIPFKENSPPVRSYGFFHGKLVSQDKVLGHVVTTHFQPYETEEGRFWREKQMGQVLSYMQEKARIETEDLFILCGDLNIEWGNKEPAELLISKYFYNANNQNTLSRSFENRTCCDFSDYWWKANRDIKKFVTEPEIIDYALLLQTFPSNDIPSRFSMETDIIPMNDYQFPEQAVSDHHGLFTRFCF